MPMVSIIIRVRILPADAELESVPLGRGTGVGDNVVNDGFLGVLVSNGDKVGRGQRGRVKGLKEGNIEMYDS